MEFGAWQSPTRWDQTRDSAQVPGALRARLHQRPEHTLEPAHPAASHPHPAPGAPGTGGSGGRRPSAQRAGAWAPQHPGPGAPSCAEVKKTRIESPTPLALQGRFFNQWTPREAPRLLPTPRMPRSHTRNPGRHRHAPQICRPAGREAWGSSALGSIQGSEQATDPPTTLMTSRQGRSWAPPTARLGEASP